MLTPLVRNIALFLYVSFVVSFVWAALNQKGFKRIVREGLKTFYIFTLCAFVLSVIVHLLS